MKRPHWRTTGFKSHCCQTFTPVLGMCSDASSQVAYTRGDIRRTGRRRARGKANLDDGASAAKQRTSEPRQGVWLLPAASEKRRPAGLVDCTPASHHRPRISPPTQRTLEASTRQEQFEWWAHLVGVVRVHTIVRRRRRWSMTNRSSCGCRFSCRLNPTLSGIAKGEQRQITLSVNDLTISCRTSYPPSVAW